MSETMSIMIPVCKNEERKKKEEKKQKTFMFFKPELPNSFCEKYFVLPISTIS